MAEIEHFMDPAEKSHPKFDSVRDVEVALYSGSNQMDGKGTVKTTIGKAVDEVRRRGFELRAAGVGSLNYGKFELRDIGITGNWNYGILEVREIGITGNLNYGKFKLREI
jgi:hypothetical protein